MKVMDMWRPASPIDSLGLNVYASTMLLGISSSEC
jgi:hypothetical protein